jgi:hypothetical protein
MQLAVEKKRSVSLLQYTHAVVEFGQFSWEPFYDSDSAKSGGAYFAQVGALVSNAQLQRSSTPRSSDLALSYSSIAHVTLPIGTLLRCQGLLFVSYPQLF